MPIGFRKTIAFLAIAAVLIFGFAHPLRAQTLGASCSNSGWISVEPNQLLYCNGSTWTIGHEITTSGLQGIGTASPVVTLQVNGEIMPGNTGVGCSSTTKGALRYNSTAGALQFCDGSNWGSLPSSVCSGSTPAGFVFTNVTGAAVSTLTTSNIVQITGISCNVTVSVSGGGSPQYRICSDNACGTVVTGWTSSSNFISANQYVQLRLTSSNAGSTALTSTLAVGSSSSSWSVTTQGYCTGSSPTPNTVCTDGSLYAGLDAGNIQMFIQHCDFGQSWNGSTCSGSAGAKPWNNGAGSGTSSGATSSANGLANTSTLYASGDTDSPYQAARYCHTLNEDGHTDWFLPSSNQLLYIMQQAASASGSTFPTPSSYTRYWSSTEINTTNAYQVQTNASTYSESKVDPLQVRCMRETGGGTPCGTHSGTISTQTAQTITVPAGCAVTFKAWGGGGGGGYSSGNPGGGGGYSTITLSATVSDVTYYLETGGPGAFCCNGAAGGGASGFSGGGPGGPSSGGSGAGATGVWTGGYGSAGTPVIVAGGGGGGANNCDATDMGGGGSGPYNSASGGGASSFGGGGGAGYPYGGSGATSNYCNGYGGQNYIISGGSGGTSAGSSYTPGNSGDTNYPTGAGLGGNNPSSAYAGTGAVYYSY